MNSKVKFTKTGKNKADYNVDKDTINIKPTSRFKDFLVTVFHEIDHAKDAQRLGKKKYKQQYEIEMNKAVQRGGDAHDDNFYEKKYQIKTKRLDSYFVNKKIDNIFLKIDVEGFELNVLKGAKKLISKQVKLILVEKHFFQLYKDYTPDEVDIFLKKNNFRLLKKFTFPLLYFQDNIYIKK